MNTVIYLSAQWHNPENVPADKVPSGWRFLTVVEAKTLCSDKGLRWLPNRNIYEFDPPITSKGADDYLRNNWTYLIRDDRPISAQSLNATGEVSQEQLDLEAADAAYPSLSVSRERDAFLAGIRHARSAKEGSP